MAKPTPPGGWKPKTLYLVLVQRVSNNPPWRGVMYSGYLTEKGTPGAYSSIWPFGSRHSLEYHDLYAVTVLRELASADELRYPEPTNG